MDIRKFFQDCLLVMFLLNIHRGLSIQDDDYEDGPAFGRCPWIRNKLKNGRVRYRYKGRIAKFLCDSGYELAGKRSSTCVRGQWSNPVPVCVARGCSRVPSISNGRVTTMYRGALLVYDCNPGYTISGDSSIHCDGRRWSASPPVCGVSTPDPETHCDFENPFLCGWSHDLTHDFDWKRNQFATPSGHVGTGPSHDHTFGENKAGYYLYIEASSPRKINDTARLFSPVYPADESGGCFTFWYHMYGATTGGIRVYLKPESHVFGELSPKWEKFGDQGNQWFRGNIDVPKLNENFQVVIEGMRGKSYVGDSAIDDVLLSKLDCESLENVTETATDNTNADSCRGRCRGSDTSSSCECNENCIAAKNCCIDYLILCSEGNETSAQLTDEPLPGDYYGNTTSPVTVTVTSTSLKTTERQTPNSLSNISVQSTSQSSKAASLSTTVLSTSSAVTVTSNYHPLSSTSSVVPTTEATTSASRATTFTTKSSTVEDKSMTIPIYVQPTRLSNTVPNTEASTAELSTTLTKLKVKTTDKGVTSASTNPVETVSSTKATVVTSTRSAAKQITKTSLTPEVSTSTTTNPTTTATQISRTSTTITSPISTTTTLSPASTTTPLSRISTTTTISPSSTTTTISPSSTTTTISPTSLTRPSTTERATTINILPISSTQFESSSTSILTTAKSSSVSSSSTIADTTTSRYNLRPRKTTSPSSSTVAFSTSSNYSSATKNSTFISATTAPSKTQTNTTSSVINSTSQTRRRFNFTIFSTSTVRVTTKTSTTVAPPVTTTSTQYTPETSKYSYRRPIPTPMVQTSSFPTTSDSFEMIASKSESTKSNGSPAITISIVVFVIICLVCGFVFYIRKYRSRRQSKLDDDSEMRFLPESDYMDYSEASALDKILK